METLPTEVLALLLQYIDSRSSLRLEAVSRKYCSLLRFNQHHWRAYCDGDFNIEVDHLSALLEAEERKWSWRELYRFVFEHRIVPWRRRLSITRGSFPRTLECLNHVIMHHIQSAAFASEVMCEEFGRDLQARAALFMEMDQVEAAIGDLALAVFVNYNCRESHALASELIHMRGPGSFLKPDFCFDKEYDKVVLSGTLFDRSRFLLEAEYWLGPSCILCLHQYLLCDMLKVWPRWIVLKAQRSARHEYERLICHAWMKYDARDTERALISATTAVACLPLGGRLTSDAAFAHFTLGFVAQFSDEAISSYKRYIDCDPLPSRLAVTFNNLGSIYYHRGETETALSWLQRAKAANPRYFMTYKNLAKCFNRQGNRLGAVEELTIAAASCPAPCAEIYAERSRYSRLPLPDLDEATRINPRLSFPYRMRAALSFDAGHVSRCLQEISSIIDLSCDAADLALRAGFKKDAGMVSEARADMMLALTLDPNNAAYKSWLLSPEHWPGMRVPTKTHELVRMFPSTCSASPRRGATHSTTVPDDGQVGPSM